MEGYPRVQIRLDAMKEAILQAFTLHQIAEDADVKAAVEQAVKEFDAQKFIYQEAAQILRDQVRQCVREAVSQAFWENDAFRKKIVGLVRTALLDEVFPKEGA